MVLYSLPYSLTPVCPNHALRIKRLSPMGGSNWIPQGLGTNSLNRYIQPLLCFAYTSLVPKYPTPLNPYETLIRVFRKHCLQVINIHYMLKKLIQQLSTCVLAGEYVCLTLWMPCFCSCVCTCQLRVCVFLCVTKGSPEDSVKMYIYDCLCFLLCSSYHPSLL